MNVWRLIVISTALVPGHRCKWVRPEAARGAVWRYWPMLSAGRLHRWLIAAGQSSYLDQCKAAGGEELVRYHSSLLHQHPVGIPPRAQDNPQPW